MSAQLLEFPDANVHDIPRMLRKLADDIENGKFENAHNVVWVLDKGCGQVEIGLMGAAAEAGPVAYLLLGLGSRKIEDGCIIFDES